MCRTKDRILAHAREQALDVRVVELRSTDGAAVEDVAAMLDSVLIHASNNADDLAEAKEALEGLTAQLESSSAQAGGLEAALSQAQAALVVAQAEGGASKAAEADARAALEAATVQLDEQLGRVAELEGVEAELRETLGSHCGAARRERGAPRARLKPRKSSCRARSRRPRASSRHRARAWQSWSRPGVA